MNSRLNELFQKYFDGSATSEELAELSRISGVPENEPELRAALQTAWNSLQAKESALDDVTRTKILQNILGLKKNQPVIRIYWRRQAAAAAVLIILAGTLWLINHNKKQEPQISQQLKNDVQPGNNKAVLTLSNGKTIILDSASNGRLATQGNANVLKTDSGKLVYQANNNEKNAEVEYNTLTTPRGGQHMLTLADGSQVWLNAASSITFPTAFTGNARNVQITGEAYFEVVKNPRLPFTVSVNGQTVRVLGTHFNINAYSDEGPVRTTLLEGSVKITRDNNNKTTDEITLRPGQQAQVNIHQMTVVNNADIDQVMAWKNGLFHFNNASLQEVMRQVSRWYDVDVIYEGNADTGGFSGEIGRGLTLAQVLKILERTRVHFRIDDGRKIVILP
jgi:transmembrane sensor